MKPLFTYRFTNRFALLLSALLFIAGFTLNEFAFADCTVSSFTIENGHTIRYVEGPTGKKYFLPNLEVRFKPATPQLPGGSASVEMTPESQFDYDNLKASGNGFDEIENALEALPSTLRIADDSPEFEMSEFCDLLQSEIRTGDKKKQRKKPHLVFNVLAQVDHYVDQAAKSTVNGGSIAIEVRHTDGKKGFSNYLVSAGKSSSLNKSRNNQSAVTIRTTFYKTRALNSGLGLWGYGSDFSITPLKINLSLGKFGFGYGTAAHYFQVGLSAKFTSDRVVQIDGWGFAPFATIHADLAQRLNLNTTGECGLIHSMRRDAGLFGSGGGWLTQCEINANASAWIAGQFSLFAEFNAIGNRGVFNPVPGQPNERIHQDGYSAHAGVRIGKFW